jgi:lipoyl(octanoyl) transferase
LLPEIENLGRAAYEPVLAQMRALHAAVHAGHAAGRVLLVEHEPVYTAGRATPPADLRPGIVPIERGGRITYHGPGQLVVYPIVRLPRRDVRDWLRRLESFGMRIAQHFGLVGEPSVDGTGVFVGGRKFASIGVHVKHWINLHVIGVNIAMDLQPWHAIRPCGLAPDVMTDLSRAAGRTITMAEAVAAAHAAVSVLADPGDPL